MADKKISEQLGAAIFEAGKEIVGKKLSKAQYDKSYKTTIVGCNRYFTDDVPAETQAELIKKYNIPEVSVSGVYYTFRINGNWYVKSSNNDFKLYEEVVVRVPNGNWDNMFIEVQRDTVSEGGGTVGVGKNVGNDSEIFNRYEGSNANVIDGAYAAHAEGSQNTITGVSFASHAEGSENRISGSRGAHAEGYYNGISNSDYAHVEGEYCSAYNAKRAHAGGAGSSVYKDSGFAHGVNVSVHGIAAAAFGSETYAGGKDQFVAGRGNKTDEEDKYALIIGNGTGTRGLSGFAPTRDWEGNLWVSGSLNYSGGAVTNYTAGRGIEINNGKIGINIASENVLGGVKAGSGITVAEDGTISAKGKDFMAGDGIDITDTTISVKPATSNTIGGIKAGKGLKISSDGTLEAEGGGGSYTAGNGIEITEDNVINVKQATSTELGGIILGEGLEYDPATGKTNTVPNIQQAVILQEKDAKYLLHEYTTVEYIAGNRICYAGAQNQIIVQGYIIYKKGGTAPNGITVAKVSNADVNLLPDIPLYTNMNFNSLVYHTYNPKNTVKRLYITLNVSETEREIYYIKRVYGDDTEATQTSFSNYNKASYGFSFIWREIYPPGHTIDSQTFPYGCALCTLVYKAKTSSASYQFQEQDQYYAVGFASEAEYNAAVGLTYEPQTLVNVEETITEV